MSAESRRKAGKRARQIEDELAAEVKANPHEVGTSAWRNWDIDCYNRATDKYLAETRRVLDQGVWVQKYVVIPAFTLFVVVNIVRFIVEAAR